MQKILPVIFFLLFTISANSQTVFSFNCSRDTTISCPTVCFTLNAKTCDLRTFGAGSTYSINPISGTTPGTCFAPYVDPGAPGNPITLNIDDRYSGVIPLGFNFPFFGTVFNSLIVSTNGYVSFDVSLANGFSHWNIINGTTPQDLPSTFYDRGLIMGPYHDLDPSEPTSPTMQIKYDIVGTAPQRRFIFSFYKVPLFSGACNTFIENTHQIVLYESTGIIEVFINSKQICPGWNQGRSMIGLQDFGRTQAVMPIGRRASDPSWGSINMNESWRFVPTGGTGRSLLKRVELIDFAGNVIVPFGSAVVTYPGNGIIDVDFPNVCPPTDPASYIVRSVYEKFDNPAIDIIAHDTVRVLRLPATFSVTATNTNALCNGETATITVTSPIGPTYEYSIDGTTWQSSPVFTLLPAGLYTVRAREGGTFCSSSTTANITQPSPLGLTATAANTNCTNNNGSITITAGGGTPAYEYSIDNGVTYQPSNQFLNLSAGNYNDIIVRDANGCLQSLTETVALNDTMRLDLGADSAICFGSSITLIPQTNALTDTFKWTPAATLNFDTVRTPIASPRDTTKYYLTAKWGVCQRTDSITINVLHKPVAYAGSDTTICYKTNATLFGSASNLSGTVNYAWLPPDSLNTPNAASTIARIDTTRQFTLRVTDNYGCNFLVTDSVMVFMQPLLVVFAGNDTNAILGRPHQLQASGGVNYVWTPAGPLNNPFIANPLAILYNDTYFNVQVTDAIGCTDDDDVFVKVYEGPMYYLPNAFTPNGDGLNDIFRPTPVGIRSTDYFMVFNRYGAKMYETRQWMQGWDGTLKGKPASSGTYVWMIKGIDKNGAVVEMKGTVILVR